LLFRIAISHSPQLRIFGLAASLSADPIQHINGAMAISSSSFQRFSFAATEPTSFQYRQTLILLFNFRRATYRIDA
jgi:hypothetical protein